VKINVYVIDFEIPPRVKRWGVRIGIPPRVRRCAPTHRDSATLLGT
jgi:hypothetical protein